LKHNKLECISRLCAVHEQTILHDVEMRSVQTKPNIKGTWKETLIYRFRERNVMCVVVSPMKMVRPERVALPR